MGREQTNFTGQRAERSAGGIPRTFRQLSEEEIERRWQQTLNDWSECERREFIQTVRRCHIGKQQ